MPSKWNKMFWGNLLSVYTLYTDNIPLTTCWQYSVLWNWTYDRNLCLKLGRFQLWSCLSLIVINIRVQIIPFASQRVYIIPSHKVFLFVFVRKITCYKVRIICGVTHCHGKQILFCTREKPELPRLRIIKGSNNSRVPNIHATPAHCGSAVLPVVRYP